MKAKIALLLSFAITASTLTAANVRFNLRDFLESPAQLVRRQAVMEPQSSPLASGTNVVLSERRTFNTGSAAEFTATNVVEGVYRVIVYGPTRTNMFRILVPDVAYETNASAILISSTDTGIDTEDGRSIDIE